MPFKSLTELLHFIVGSQLGGAGGAWQGVASPASYIRELPLAKGLR